MIKRLLIVAIALFVVFGGIFGWKAYQSRQAESVRATSKPPPAIVSSTQARLDLWQPTVTAVGGLSAIQGVDVSSEVPGKILSINFESGQSAKKGQLLIQLDASSEEAELRSLAAEMELARLDLTRAQDLVKRGAVSQAQLDRAVSRFESLKAQVEEKRAMVEKKAIRAPFSGELGIRQVNVGQYVSPGTPIVSLQSLDPIYANFTLPEQFLKELAVGQPVDIEAPAFPGEPFEGKITAVSPQVDSATRNVQVQATLANESKQLRPGMFARVSVRTGDQQHILTLPETAVSYFPYGNSVFIIEEQNGEAIAERRQVNTGRVREGRIEIVSGLEEGDLVVNSGQVKLDSGQNIKVDNTIELGGGITEP